MRVVIVGRDNTDYAREVSDWVRDFERQTRKSVEILDPDTREGESFCRARDIVEYPTVIVVDENMGGVAGMWRGRPLPQIDEVAYIA